jgi:hypothetical protein
MELDLDAISEPIVQEDLPRELVNGPEGRDLGAARRRLEDVLEERRVRREIASLDMDSFDIEDIEFYE